MWIFSFSVNTTTASEGGNNRDLKQPVHNPVTYLHNVSEDNETGAFAYVYIHRVLYKEGYITPKVCFPSTFLTTKQLCKYTWM
jgi:hypothetical protein